MLPQVSSNLNLAASSTSLAMAKAPSMSFPRATNPCPFKRMPRAEGYSVSNFDTFAARVSEQQMAYFAQGKISLSVSIARFSPVILKIVA